MVGIIVSQRLCRNTVLLVSTTASSTVFRFPNAKARRTGKAEEVEEAETAEERERAEEMQEAEG